MNLTLLFDKDAAGNPYFYEIYHGIANRFKNEYSNHNVEIRYTNDKERGCFSCPGGSSNFQIINPDNNKTILMSFWDRGMDPLCGALGWENYKIVQYIGGLGMYKTSEEIKKDHNIDHYPYQYPLGVRNSYQYIDELRAPYDPEKKVRKAVFIGAIYGTRNEFYPFFKNHPLIDIFTNADVYHGRDYFNKLKDYRMCLSMNGNGELALRDFESMGLNIPVVRSKMLTQFHNPWIPNHHYFASTEPCTEAFFVYRGVKIKDLAEQFISCIESNIDNFDKLKTIADNGYNYFNSYCRTNYIIDLFFKLVKVNDLE